jgi:hypothetical protein
MVKGLEVFRDYFAGQADQFVLIGGTAATLAVADAGLAFRATKDLDIVLHIEALTSDFPRTPGQARQGLDPEGLQGCLAETTPLRDPEYYQCDFNLTDVAEVWRRGSVIASSLLDLTAVLEESEPLEVRGARLGLRGRTVDHQGGHQRGGGEVGEVATKAGANIMSELDCDALVFFGATGDLAYKKIFPSLQAMVKRGTLNVPVIGVSKSGLRARGCTGHRRKAFRSRPGIGAGAQPNPARYF